MCPFSAHVWTDHWLGQWFLRCLSRNFSNFQVRLPSQSDHATNVAHIVVHCPPLTSPFQPSFSSSSTFASTLFLPGSCPGFSGTFRAVMSANDLFHFVWMFLATATTFRCLLRHYLDCWSVPLKSVQRVPSQMHTLWMYCFWLSFFYRHSFQPNRPVRTLRFGMR